MNQALAQRLLRLQELDSAIDSLRTQLCSSPSLKKLEDVESKLAEVGEKLAAAEKQLVSLRSSQSELEWKLASVEEKTRFVEDQLFGGEVRSSRELMGLQHELDRLKDEKSAIETELIDVMVRSEDAERSIGAMRKALREAEKEMASLKISWDSESTEIHQRISLLEQEKKPIVDQLDPELLESYGKLRTHLGGLAVARLDGMKCTGCNVDLSRAALEEIARAGDETPRCENCGRMIVIAQSS